VLDVHLAAQLRRTCGQSGDRGPEFRANVPQVAQGDAIRAAGGRAAAFEAQYTSILCS
jgi:hypothetical protein